MVSGPQYTTRLFALARANWNSRQREFVEINFAECEVDWIIDNGFRFPRLPIFEFTLAWCTCARSFPDLNLRGRRASVSPYVGWNFWCDAFMVHEMRVPPAEDVCHTAVYSLTAILTINLKYTGMKRVTHFRKGIEICTARSDPVSAVRYYTIDMYMLRPKSACCTTCV